MGALHAKIFKKEPMRIIFQGLDAAGKTTILYRMKLGDVVTTIPTIGFNVETVEHKNIQITAWDVGGRDKIRPLWRHYYQNTRALVFVVDSADHDPDRIEQARDELHRALEEESLKDAVVLILANKQDLANAWSAMKVAEELQLHKLKTRRVWNIFATAGTTGDGLYEALDWLTDTCKRKQNGDDVETSSVTEAKVESKITSSSTSDIYNNTLLNKAWGTLKKVFLAQA